MLLCISKGCTQEVMRGRQVSRNGMDVAASLTLLEGHT